MVCGQPMMIRQWPDGMVQHDNRGEGLTRLMYHVGPMGNPFFGNLGGMQVDVSHNCFEMRIWPQIGKLLVAEHELIA